MRLEKNVTCIYYIYTREWILMAKYIDSLSISSGSTNFCFDITSGQQTKIKSGVVRKAVHLSVINKVVSFFFIFETKLNYIY